MAHSTPYPLCAFCGKRADSREHVIPKWIGKRLGIREFLPLETAIQHGVTPRKQPISFRSYRVRVFCKGCNKHFKQLEDAVIPLLEPMARGRVLSLGRDSQELLALWAAKTAVAALAAVPELRDVVPPDHRRAIRQDGRVNLKTWITFFPWNGGPVLGTSGGVAVRNQDPSVRYETYAALLSFGEVAFWVLGFTTGPSSEEKIESDRAPINQFWPPLSAVIHWPTGDRVTNAILPELFNHMPLRSA